MTDQGPLILIVDDSPEDREAARRQLLPDPAGYRVAGEGSGEGARAACRAAPPACLLLDYDLADETGLEFLDKLTGGTGQAPFPVVMLTGKGSEAVAVQALKRGASDYLVKGQFDADGLRRAVADAVGKFAARAGLERRRAEAEGEYRDAGRRERLVLVVDDSPEDREATRRYLSADPGTAYRLLEEGTGADGLAVCRSAGLDCLLLDYSLPDTDGVEFLQDLTGGTGVAPFPVLMLTGRGDEAVAVRSLKHGATDYLVKGRFTPDALRRAVDQAVEKAAARRAEERRRVRELERLEADARARADELAEANRRKDEFLAMLAHELRNPLAPIRNAMRVLSVQGRGNPALEATCGMVENQVRHMARIVDDLLDVSRVTRGAIELRRGPVDAVAAARRAAETKHHHFAERRHALVLSAPPGPVWVEADDIRVQQILGNLLTNAAKYTGPGGRVELAVGRDGADAVFRVRDTGIGIPPELLPKVFDLFVQGARTLARSEGGLGIGLTLVKNLAELHGGTVEARSDGPGAGSEFVVRLPLQAGAPAAAAAPPAPAPPAPAGRVLVVDDNADAAATLAMFLELGGFAVAVAHDGPAALAEAAAARPDVVLLDIGLPGMDGYEVARRLRASPGTADTVLVAVTGYDQEHHRRQSRAAGFDLHLVKPVDLDVVERIARDAPTLGRQAARA
jgi:CheY-like chemotaxis protein